MADEDEKPRAVKESFDYADWQKVAEIKKQCPRCGPTGGLEGTHSLLLHSDERSRLRKDAYERPAA